MIYSIVGTNTKEREGAYKSLEKMGPITAHIYSEQIATLEPLVSASSLFGEKVVVNVIQVMDVAFSRDVMIELLPSMKKSDNIFIIDEPFADVNRVKRLEKYSEKLFDARVEKEKEAFPSSFLFAFEKRDKKNAWIEWMKLRDMDAEKLHGALWWKFQMLWNNVRAGKPSKFTLRECEDFGGKLMRAPIEAHRGNKDLKTELEMIVLSL